MQNTNIFVSKLNDIQRQIDWIELNQLKKDILWVFDENGGDLHNAYIPDYSFTLPYWEYVTLNGDKYFYDEQKNFYKEGALIIILCMVAEYVDIQGGSQLVFHDNKIEDILVYINRFEPVNEQQSFLRDIVILGLSIAVSITEEDIARNEDFEHPDLSRFYEKLPLVDKTFIQTYFKSKQG
jgi:hypothetical protein